MEIIGFKNGLYLPTETITLSPTDLAVTRGYCIFEYFRCYKRSPFHVKSHMSRFLHSANLIGIKHEYSMDNLLEIIDTLSSKNDLDNLQYKLYLSPGTSKDGLTPNSEPTLIIIPSQFFASALEKKPSIKLKTTQARRFLPECKTTFYLPGIIEVNKARSCGFDDILYLDEHANVLEVLTGNLLAFFGDTLVAPESQTLPGVTRDVIMQIAKDFYDVEVKNLSLDRLKNADEIFTCSSRKEIQLVSQVDDVFEKDPSLYSRSEKLKRLFSEYTNEISHADAPCNRG